MRIAYALGLAALLTTAAAAQAPPAAAPITLAKALQQARANSPAFEQAVVAEGVAKAGAAQARAALLPSLTFNGGAIYTQDFRFIAANAPNEYLAQGNVQESFNFGSAATLRRAHAAQALAAAQKQIAARGLDASVTAGYYTVVAADHELSTAQQALADAQKYLHISQELENGGEVAHSDVIKAQLQLEQRQRDLRQTQLAREQAKLQLAVLLFPDFHTTFTLVDDLAHTPGLPPFARIQALAHRQNPILGAAAANLNEASQDVAIARAGFLPALSLNYTYGLDAAQFALRNQLDLPNLGSAASASLSFPLFDWGARRAQVEQAHLLRQQAQTELKFTRRQLASQLHSLYAEAQAARSELTTLARSRQLAAESLHLSALRYKDGEATILELVDAQNANTLARNDYDNGLVRYRVALAQLKTLTGPF